MKYACRIASVFFVSLLLSCAFAWASGDIEAPPSDYVDDRAGIIDAPTKASISSRLRSLDEKTGVQMIVLTVPATDGVPIEEYSIERAQKWGIGQKGKDNGILLVVAVNDRKYRIEVGYGLESIIPDSLAGSIGRQFMVPKFRQGDYSGGVNDTVNAIIVTVAASYGTEIEGTAPAEYNENPIYMENYAKIITVFFFLIMLSSFFFSLRRRGTAWNRSGTWIGTGGFGSRGSFGGGGFGGGGGSFGGGGASGGW